MANFDSVIKLGILCLIVALPVMAQNTYTAASCSASDIATQVTLENRNAHDGDIISIPAGNCTWTNQIRKTFPTTVTIQCAGAQYATGTQGSTLAGTDQTTILDHFPGGGSPLVITTSSGKTVRITGCFFNTDSGSSSHNHGIIIAQGPGVIRFDHNHISLQAGFAGIYIGGSLTGVADHNYFQCVTNCLSNDFAIHNGFGWAGASATDGADNSWYQAPGFGSSSFFFIETNQFSNGDPLDAGQGARYVFRYNTVITGTTTNPSANKLFSHGTRDGERGDAFREVYQNNFSLTAKGIGPTAVPINSGVALIWGNTIGTAYKYAVALDYTRKQNSTYSFSTPSTRSLGYCGPPPVTTGTASVGANSTAVTGSGFSTSWTAPGSNGLIYIAGANCKVNGKTTPTCKIATVNSSTSITLATPSTLAVTNGNYVVGSSWDGNTNGYGYPCLDSPARSQGQLLTGSNPNMVNSVTGTIAWPQQVLTPIYIWNNTTTGTVGLVNLVSAMFNDNVDYFQQFGTGAEPGSFNGTAGVGTGTLLPTNASAYPGAPNCSSAQYPGPGYWYSTSPTNGTLYQCTALNTWTAYYTPYTYPHPLTLTGATLSVSPNPITCAPGVVFLYNPGGAVCSTITLQNTGPITRTSLSASYTWLSDSVNWQITSNTCGTSLDASATCTFNLVFIPQAVGKYSGTLTFTSSATNSPTIVNISGYGQNPAPNVK